MFERPLRPHNPLLRAFVFTYLVQYRICRIERWAFLHTSRASWRCRDITKSSSLPAIGFSSFNLMMDYIDDQRRLSIKQGK
jgi:hypothetical protein